MAQRRELLEILLSARESVDKRRRLASRQVKDAQGVIHVLKGDLCLVEVFADHAGREAVVLIAVIQLEYLAKDRHVDDRLGERGIRSGPGERAGFACLVCGRLG